MVAEQRGKTWRGILTADFRDGNEEPLRGRRGRRHRCDERQPGRFTKQTDGKLSDHLTTSSELTQIQT